MTSHQNRRLRYELCSTLKPGKWHVHACPVTNQQCAGRSFEISQKERLATIPTGRPNFDLRLLSRLNTSIIPFAYAASRRWRETNISSSGSCTTYLE